MKKEWFEPGPDGVSPFGREYRSLECAEISTRIAAAFRALLAKEDAEPDTTDYRAIAQDEAAKRASLEAEIDALRSEMRIYKDERMAAEIERDAAEIKGERLAHAYLDLHAQLAAKDRRIAALEAALGEAVESIEDWAGYAPDYFKDKHDLQGDIDRLTAIKEGRDERQD